MQKQRIQTDKSPAAIGPYSQAIRLGNLVFVSGMLPIVPETGELLMDDVTAMTDRIFTNLAALLAEAGSSLDQVVKTTVFLADLNDFAVMNAAYAKHFGANPPARSTVQVAKLPRDARVEIEAIAYID
jgi:2-iminobutanoate/2-iminopropanoate deaminase